MPAIYIRDYDEARDGAAFRALNYQTFRDSIPPDEPMDEGEFRRHHAWLISQFSPQDKARNAVFVAEVDGRYAGHLWLGTQTDFFTRRVDPWVFDLSVLQDFRHQGVARALHDHAVAWLRKRGSKLLGLQVMAHNRAAAQMYESLGYQPRAYTLKLKL